MFRTLSFVIVAAAAVACTKPDAPAPAPSVTPVASAAPLASASAATSAAHEEIAVILGDAGCGSKESPCPLQAWMKENANPPMTKPDLPELAVALDKMVAFAPPGGGYPNWSSIAKDGAAAARNGDKDAAKAACRSCHDQYKKKYQTEMRGRKI